MTDAEKFYREYGGCSCHTCPPCSFCLLLTEEEADALSNGGYMALEDFWNKRDPEADEWYNYEPRDQWVVMFDYERQ